VEALEQAVGVGWRNAGSVILDLESNAAFAVIAVSAWMIW